MSMPVVLFKMKIINFKILTHFSHFPLEEWIFLSLMGLQNLILTFIAGAFAARKATINNNKKSKTNYKHNI